MRGSAEQWNGLNGGPLQSRVINNTFDNGNNLGLFGLFSGWLPNFVDSKNWIIWECGINFEFGTPGWINNSWLGWQWISNFLLFWLLF